MKRAISFVNWNGPAASFIATVNVTTSIAIRATAGRHQFRVTAKWLTPFARSSAASLACEVEQSSDVKHATSLALYSPHNYPTASSADTSYSRRPLAQFRQPALGFLDTLLVGFVDGD